MNKKAYVYLSLICVLSLVLSCFTVGAASMTASYTIQSQVYATLVNVYYPELDETGNPVGNEVIATYEYSVSPAMSFSSYDGYINGTTTSVFTIYPTAPAGGTRCGVTANYNGIQSDTIYTASSSSSGANLSQAQINITSYFSNHVAHSATQRMNSIYGTCSYRFPYTGSNAPDPEPYLTVNCIVSNSYGNLALSVDPLSTGMPEIIAAGIISALSDTESPFEDLLTYIQNTNSILTDIYNHNEQWYSAIVDELLANNQWNSTITDELIALYQELSINTNATINIATYTADLRSFMQTFPTWSAQMLQLLGRLADMNATQQTEAADIASQYDSLQQQQDNANAIIEGVARPTFAQGQFSGTNLVPQGQRGTFTGFLTLITSNNYITTILLIIMTFATAGFVLFGKKK